MTLCENEGSAKITCMYDIKGYFYSESVFDCCSEIYKSQVTRKLYRLLFNLNKYARVKVQTSVWTSQPGYTDPLITQGSIEAAVLSAVNLDSGIKDEFHEKLHDKEGKEKEKDGKDTTTEKTSLMKEHIRQLTTDFPDFLERFIKLPPS